MTDQNQDGLPDELFDFDDQDEPSNSDVGQGTGTSKPSRRRAEEGSITASALSEGTVLKDNYVIKEQLGQGGMGRVFRAYDRALERDVAVKLLRESISKRGDTLGDTLNRRFSKEALLPAGLSHPNIITIFERGQHQGTEFFVMEYVADSRSLGDVVDEAHEQDELIDLQLAKTWFVQAALGLKAIHSQEGTWHRDIKLDNLIVFELPGGDPGLKIIDFGISHCPDAELTQFGSTLGTPRYIAPEFCKMDPETCTNIPLDHRADLYALGVVLYQVLTLRHPYPHIRTLDDAYQTYRKKEPKNLPRLPSAIRPDLPPGWDRITMRLLEWERGERYQSAADFAADINQVESLGGYEGDGARIEEDTPNIRPPRDKDEEQESRTTIPPSAEGARVAVKGQEQSSPAGSPWRNALAQSSGSDTSRARKIIYGAGAVFALVLVAGVFLVQGVDTFSKKAEPVAAWTPPDKKEQNVKEWMSQMENQKPLFEAPKAPAVQKLALDPKQETREVATPPSVEPHTKGKKQRGGQKRSSGQKTRSAPAETPKPQQEDVEEDPYAEWTAMYGDRKNLNTGILRVNTNKKEDEQTTTASVAGLRLSAKLQHDVASNPAGAAVIARLSKAQKFGGRLLQAGTEVHGRVAGNNATRVFVEFTFFRLKNGTTVDFRGTAHDSRGRKGLPGRKSISPATAGSVAAETAANVAREGGNALADKVDNTLSQVGIRSSLVAAAGKSDRLDHDEAVVVVKKGTRLQVYSELGFAQ